MINEHDAEAQELGDGGAVAPVVLAGDWPPVT